MHSSIKRSECVVRTWESTVEDYQELVEQKAAVAWVALRVIYEFEQMLLRASERGAIRGPVHTCIGQEGGAIGTTLPLQRRDKIVGTHRAHHQYLAKGLCGSLQEWRAHEALPSSAYELVRALYAELLGLESGCCRGRGGSMHLYNAAYGVMGTSAIVGGGLPLATGLALAEARSETGAVVLCYFGDGAVNQGVVHECMNMAAIWRLPILFVIENNLYAECTRVDETSSLHDLAARAGAYGLDGHVVHGDDIIAVSAATQHLCERARAGRGPGVLELKTYRALHHTGSKDGSELGYRSRAEEQQWAERSALLQFPSTLLQQRVMTEARLQALSEQIDLLLVQVQESCASEQLAAPVRSIQRESSWIELRGGTT